MIPILFKADEENFASYGIGTLKDVISCEVIEKVNAEFECVFKYPVQSPLYTEIQNQRIIKAKANDTSQNQLFRIYRISTVIDGIITVYAQHISYDLLDIATLPFSSNNISASLVMDKLFVNSATNHNFTYQTDFDNSAQFSVEKPKSIRSSLGDMLFVFGGEFEWDNFNVKLHSSRGSETDVVIEYGKNLTDLQVNQDISTTYSNIFPYAIYDDETIILTEQVLSITNTNCKTPRTLIMDFSEFFDDEEITEDKLRLKCEQYLAENPLGIATKSITISFEPLWQQKQYSALLERVSLCDTVTVRHLNFGVDVKSKVVKTEYDTLNEKYISITLGEAKSNLLDDVNSTKDTINKVDKEVKKLPTIIKSAVEKSSALITGQSGGYVVLNGDETGQPYEILILDQPTIDKAVNVWRWNSGGLGFSSSGYNGKFDTAITYDGKIVADFITSGTLLANIIKAGVISSVDESSYWDLETGEVHLSAYAKSDEVSESLTQIKANADGLQSYVSSVTTLIEETDEKANNLETENEKIKEELTKFTQKVNEVSTQVSEKFVGGINFVQNSSGLNGLSDDWTYEGTVRTASSNVTISKSKFVLADTSYLRQEITNLTDNTCLISARALKTYGSYTAHFKITYNEDKEVYLFNTQDSFDWTDFSIILEDVSSSSLTIEIYSRQEFLYVSDILVTNGNTVQKWSPAPNEIYTNEVKIDKRGIEVSNSKSSQTTVITNTEFAGYYNDEVVFTLNKDETKTKKTTVDGELTVGKVKFIPHNTSSGNGLNIVVLD